MLALLSVKRDASQSANACPLRLLEVYFDPAYEPLGSIFELAPRNLYFLTSVINLPSLYQFVTVSLLEELVGALGVQVIARLLIALLHCEVKLTVFSYGCKFGPDRIVFFIAGILGSFKHLPPKPDLADMD